MDWDAAEVVLRQKMAVWFDHHSDWQAVADRFLTLDPVTQARISFYLGALCGLHHSEAEGVAFDAEMARLNRKYIPSDVTGPIQHLVKFYEEIEDEQLQRWTQEQPAEGEKS